MTNEILGIHHITAIANQAQRNYEFYTRVLGLRMVKKTVNFDDPSTYHLYYGNEEGTPGTILTFFPWEGIGQGKAGIGMVTEIGYSVPEGSFEFWIDRFNRFNVQVGAESQFQGERLIPFTDPDGLNLTLIISKSKDDRKPWETKEVKVMHAIKGFQCATLSLKKIDETARVLTEILGYREHAQEGNRYRFITKTIDTASVIDLFEIPDGKIGRSAAGTNHHIAFRVSDETIQMAYREKILEYGLPITPKINRDYFFSLYFREPGGVLFEIATDNPGFSIDEPLEELGSTLKLPKQFEAARAKIEKILPVLRIEQL